MRVDPIAFAIPVFLATILIELAVSRWLRRNVYNLADAVASLNLGTMSRIAPLVVGGLTEKVYPGVFAHFRIMEWPASGWLPFVSALILYDLGYYWSHRLNHEIGVMWASHVVHHSSEYYNLTTALRQSSTGFLFGWIAYMPLAVLGAPPALMGVVGLINLLYQYWVHTELIGRLGVLDYILVTPSNHRVHHGQNDWCIDRNYGGMFILWDILFGTFQAERSDEPIVYGVRKPLHSWDPIWGNLHVYADLLIDCLKARGLADRMSVWLTSPGGWRDGHPAPLDPSSVIRFHSFTQSRVGPFVICQLCVSIALVVGYLVARKAMPADELALVFLMLVAGMVAQGGLLRGRPWAGLLMAAQLLTLAAWSLTAPDLFTVQPAQMTRRLLALACGCAVVWLWRIRRSAPAGAVSA